jgi:glycosyltransferase involved in cell wall biosynthesis
MSQKQIKLFFVIDSISLGGAERVISQLASHLVSRGLDCTLITFDKTDDPNFYFVDPQIKRIRLGDKNPHLVVTAKISYLRFLYISLLRFFTLRPFTKNDCNEQRVFVSFLTHINIVTAAACLFTNTKLIVSERTCPKFSAGWFGKILRSLVYLRADRIVTQTNDGKSFLPLQLRQKVLSLANPIKQHAPRNISAKPNGPRIILGVGRLSREKGFDRLIRIFHKAQSKFSDLQLIIVGDGPEKENLTKLIAKLKLEPKVSLPGAQA